MELETLQTFDQSDVKTKKTKKLQKDKNFTKIQIEKKKEIQRPIRGFNIVMSGQFCTLVMFYFVPQTSWLGLIEAADNVRGELSNPEREIKTK